MDHDTILTFILMAILLAIFIVVASYDKKTKGTARSRKHLSLYVGIAAALVFVGATAFGMKTIFLIISFAVLFVLLAIDH